MKERFEHSPEEKDNVISLEKKLAEKKKEDERHSYAKQFERDFFEYGGKDGDNVVDIEQGFDIKSEKEVLPRKKALEDDIVYFYTALDQFQKDLDRAREEGDGPQYIANIQREISNIEQKIEEKEKALESVLDEAEEFNKRAEHMRQKRIYGE